MKKWVFPELDVDMIRKLNRLYDIPLFTAMLMTIRGITEEEQIRDFFSEDGEFDDPYHIKDMDKAVDRIRKAIDSYEKICVYGDYDCDGVTSTSILYSYLDSISANVTYYIPDRYSEGYGMNMQAVEKLKNDGVELIITVDNGITALKEIEYAYELGMDVVVTDHHKPLDILPKADAVVDPHRSDETGPYRDYSGAGLAMMLVYALEDNNYWVIENYSDLAALGTVADVVPLTGENRRIVKNGLITLENTERIGLNKLIEKAGVSELNSGAIAFRLGPRINASGRLGKPDDVVELFLTEDEDIAEEKAELLCTLNSNRQSIETGIVRDIGNMVKDDPSITENRIIVFSSPNWHPGVVGIVSSKVTEKYGKPSIMISEDGDVCKGSGRSVEGFSLVDAVFACSDLLIKCGGHPMAVGFSIKKENIEPFIKRINEYADKLPYMPLYSIELAKDLKPSSISVDMVDQLGHMEPFGCRNPTPVFGLLNMRLDKITPVGGGKHLKLSVSKDRAYLSLIMFSVTQEEFPYSEGDILDFAVTLEKNVYLGRESVSFCVNDVRISGFDVEKTMLGLQDYELYKKGIFNKEKHSFFPDREYFALVYRLLRKEGKKIYTVDTLCNKLGKDIGVFRLLIILDIMNELHLIGYRRDADVLYINLCEVSGKTDLKESGIYRKLEEEIGNAGKT